MFHLCKNIVKTFLSVRNPVLSAHTEQTVLKEGIKHSVTMHFNDAATLKTHLGDLKAALNSAPFSVAYYAFPYVLSYTVHSATVMNAHNKHSQSLK